MAKGAPYDSKSWLTLQSDPNHERNLWRRLSSELMQATWRCAYGPLPQSHGGTRRSSKAQRKARRRQRRAAKGRL